MASATMRFNQCQPGLDPGETAARYQATLDLVEYGERHGFSRASLEEHHGADDGWSPSPLITAAAIFGRTESVRVIISALLIPLHDPVRIAEDIAVLDLLSGGRVTVIAGLGYRPSEYAAHDKSWEGRGRLMDEAVDAMLKAWTGDPFEFRGATVRVTPRSVTQPHPTLMIGGSHRVSARRAVRFGLPLYLPSHRPDLKAYYDEQCAAAGVKGFCVMPPARTTQIHVAEDPDKAWAELGRYFLHEATTYASWQTADKTSAVHSHATTLDELRAEGIYAVLTPEECVDLAHAGGESFRGFTMHPLVGGMPIEEAWRSVILCAEQVLPKVA
jgi:alkanesulfonate monooxygenase SsuD/methylene tetrahydromethanopterin reductase-like flavin-dependent oxidoreductase (luciferase family)